MIIAAPGAPIPPGEAGYCAAADLPVRGVARQWKYRGVRRSVQWRGGGVVKIADAFEEHDDMGALAALLAEAEARGVAMPSSYADLFHRKWRAPGIRRAHAKLFSGAVKGGWVQVTTDQVHRKEPLWQFDIRSAYLSAVRDGLPDPGSFRVVTRYCGPGVYWVNSPAMRGYPYPWSKEGIFPASYEEIEFFCLRSRVTGKGIAFEPDSYDSRAIVSDIQAWSAWKEIGRSFWGRWAAGQGPTCETLATDGTVRTSRELPPLWACPTWAAMVTSRVRLKVSQEYDRNGVLLVLTDAVVTTRPLVTGPDIGDWRQVAHFPHGGVISLSGVTGIAA